MGYVWGVPSACGVVIDGASGQGVSSSVISESTALITSGGAFDSLAQYQQSDFPTVVQLGTLTSLQVDGNVSVDSGTLHVLGMESVRMVGVQTIYRVSRPWMSHFDATLREWSGVAFGNGLFVAVAANNGGNMSSVDGMGTSVRPHLRVLIYLLSSTPTLPPTYTQHGPLEALSPALSSQHGCAWRLSRPSTAGAALSVALVIHKCCFPVFVTLPEACASIYMTVREAGVVRKLVAERGAITLLVSVRLASAHH